MPDIEPGCSGGCWPAVESRKESSQWKSASTTKIMDMNGSIPSNRKVQNGVDLITLLRTPTGNSVAFTAAPIWSAGNRSASGVVTAPDPAHKLL